MQGKISSSHSYAFNCGLIYEKEKYICFVVGDGNLNKLTQNLKKQNIENINYIIKEYE